MPASDQTDKERDAEERPANKPTKPRFFLGVDLDALEALEAKVDFYSDDVMSVVFSLATTFEMPATTVWGFMSAKIESEISQGREIVIGTRSSPGVTGGAMPTELRPACRAFNGFAAERATFAAHLPDLLDRAEGKFVVIVGETILGPVETATEAESTGYRHFGYGPLYIKQILADQSPATIARDVAICRS